MLNKKYENVILGKQDINKPRFVNYHRHTYYSNPGTVADCAISPLEYCKRDLELGHTTVTCCEHGHNWSLFDYYKICNDDYSKPDKNGNYPDNYNFKLIFAVEAYFVVDNTIEDPTNAHIVLIAKNNEGRREINTILSNAYEFGYYYKGRCHLQDILSLNKDNVMVCTACVSGLWKYNGKENFIDQYPQFDAVDKIMQMEDGEEKESLKAVMFVQSKTTTTKTKERIENQNIGKVKKIHNWSTWEDAEKDYITLKKRANMQWEDILIKLHEHFQDSLYLEIQAHDTQKQKTLNLLIKKLSKEMGIKIIAGCDTHAIDEIGVKVRDGFLYSKGVIYPDEDGWYMDYCDYDTLKNRFIEQGVFSEEEIIQAIDNTLILETFEEVYIDKSIKLPTIYPDKTQEEKNKIFTDLIWQQWEVRKKELEEDRATYRYENGKYYDDHDVEVFMPPFEEYEKEIKKEIQVIIDTSMADYFLLNYHVIDLGIRKYGGVLTKTGRGCFHPDTPVLTNKGYVKISDVSIGDKVINCLGEEDEVRKLIEYDISETMLEIHVRNSKTPIIVTKDHKIFVYDSIEKDFYFKRAKELNPMVDSLCFTFSNKNKFYFEKVQERLHGKYNIINNTLVYEISKIKPIDYTGKVYDLNIKNDPSFVVDVITVHNSAGGFYLNNLLGFTTMDRIGTNIPMLSERFISTSRILETMSLPDIDFNISLYNSFKQATDELLGEHGNYFMITYGTYHAKNAWKAYARMYDVDFDIANTVSKQIGEYELAQKHAEEGEVVDIYDFIQPEYRELYDKSKIFLGIIDNISPSPCFEKNTKILTNKGYKKIQDIEKGDLVVTHTNKYKRVINPMKSFSNEIYEVNVVGNTPIKVTGEHPFYVITKDKYGNLSDPYWKECKNLSKDDFIARPISFDKDYSYNKNAIWIYGLLYGSNSDYFEKDKQIIYNLSKSHIDYKIIDDKIFINKSEIDLNIVALNMVYSQIFLNGYLYSYNKNVKTTGVYYCNTYDKAIQLQNLIHKAFSYGIKLEKIYDTYCLTIDKESQYKSDHIWQPVESVVKSHYDDYVYNLSVEEDESYVANNIVVHNCSFVLLNGDIRREIGITRIKDVLVANITGKQADDFKYLKND